MYFKKIRSVKLPEEVQGFIRFQCLNYKKMPENVKADIKRCCFEVGKLNHKALFEVVTSKYKSVTQISGDYYIALRTLYSLRKEFYMRYAEICFKNVE